MNPETITAIIMAVMKFIQECKAKGEPPAAIAMRIENPGGRELLLLERATRQANNMSRREWKREDAKRSALMSEVHAERRRLTASAIDELVGDDDPEAVAAAFPMRSLGEPQRFSFPQVDVELVAQITAAVEVARKAAADLIDLLNRVGGTIPGLGS